MDNIDIRWTAKFESLHAGTHRLPTPLLRAQKP